MPSARRTLRSDLRAVRDFLFPGLPRREFHAAVDPATSSLGFVVLESEVRSDGTRLIKHVRLIEGDPRG